MLLAADPKPRTLGTIVTPHKGDACSAARMVIYKRPQKGLPAAVQKMRLAVIDACIKCQFDQLEKLALPGRKHFDFTFGKAKKPSAFWKSQDLSGHKTLGKMVTTLRAPFAHDGHVFVWPSAYGKNAQEKDWDALTQIYSPRDIVLFKDYGGFNGMRLAIADDGDWIYAIEGE
ncbi:MAG: hypothetical protein JWM80_5894 [Cyanobacteria bacterium RYN_339]|nr:hypothetical protein [Cyanobacteria bacterium RYN_339]